MSLRWETNVKNGVSIRLQKLDLLTEKEACNQGCFLNKGAGGVKPSL